MLSKTVLQSEASECGLACVATVAKAHGRTESLSELRRRFPISLGGTTLKSVVAIADAMGFSCRPVRCELDEIYRLEKPAILHWGLDHFVVLRRANAKFAWIADPARGERKLPISEVSKYFSGVALELTPAASFQKQNKADKVKLGDLWSRLSGFRPFLVQMFILTLLLQGVGLLSPLVNQLVVDDVINRGDRDPLVTIIVGFAILMVVQTAIELLRGFIQPFVLS